MLHLFRHSLNLINTPSALSENSFSEGRRPRTSLKKVQGFVRGLFFTLAKSKGKSDASDKIMQKARLRPTHLLFLSKLQELFRRIGCYLCR